MTRDRRLTPSNGRVAALHLQGQVAAERFVAAEPATVRGNPFLLAEPAGPRVRQMLTGDAFQCLERRDGWAYGWAGKDGYCGWLPEAALVAPAPDPSHRLQVRTTWVLPSASVRQPALADLHLGTRLTVLGTEGRWSRILVAGIEGFVPSAHLAPAESRDSDPVAVAERFLGTSYLWAGNTGFGLDCSGLAQAALLACGVACPGDSDLIEAAVGHSVRGQPYRRGDLLFWKGHVALVADPDRILHANGHAMLVCHEGLQAALDRIAAEGYPLRDHRRPG